MRKRDRRRREEEEANGLVPLNDVKHLTDQIATGEAFDVPSVRTLQRTAGNQAVLRLGAGRPLDPAIRGRMEGAFGTSFEDVRVHAGPEGARLAQAENATAFAVGRDIVLGADAPPLGTVVGDALLAHELAHVEQQRGAETAVQAMGRADASTSVLERDANTSAIAAVKSLWGGIRQNAMPALKSGVRLSKLCNGGGSTFVQGDAGHTLSNDITVNIEEAERGGPGRRKDSPNVEVEGTVTGVQEGFAELYLVKDEKRGGACNMENASPTAIWRVRVVNGKFRVVVPFHIKDAPGWGHPVLIKAGDGTHYNVACAEIAID